MADDILKQAADRAREVLPEPIGQIVRRRLISLMIAGGETGRLAAEREKLARAVLALPVPAPAVDREGLAKQAFQIAYDGVDWNETVEWVKADPDDTGAVGTARVHADTIIHQAVDALISAGLVRVPDTVEEAPRD